MASLIIVLDLDETIIASRKEYKSANNLKPYARYESLNIEVNKYMLGIIHKAIKLKNMGKNIIIILMTNNTNFTSIYQGTNEPKKFLELAFPLLIEEYNKHYKPPLKDINAMFDKIITAEDSVRRRRESIVNSRNKTKMRERPIKNLQEVRLALDISQPTSELAAAGGGGGHTDIDPNSVYIIDDEKIPHVFIKELPENNYIQIPPYEVGSDGHWQPPDKLNLLSQRLDTLEIAQTYQKAAGRTNTRRKKRYKKYRKLQK